MVGWQQPPRTACPQNVDVPVCRLIRYQNFGMILHAATYSCGLSCRWCCYALDRNSGGHLPHSRYEATRSRIRKLGHRHFSSRFYRQSRFSPEFWKPVEACRILLPFCLRSLQIVRSGIRKHPPAHRFPHLHA